MKTIKWLNNQLLPLKYSWWEEWQDETYYKIKKEIRIHWISTQHSIYSMAIPISIFLLTFMIGVLWLFINKNLINVVFWVIGIIFLIGFLYIIIYLLAILRNYDLYTDKKFIELSKK